MEAASKAHLKWRLHAVNVEGDAATGLVAITNNHNPLLVSAGAQAARLHEENKHDRFVEATG